MLDRVGWGFVALDLLVSPGLESDSLELVDCMVDPRKTYGEMGTVKNKRSRMLDLFLNLKIKSGSVQFW